MRFVIYDDESMEPVTVVNLPGVAERDIFGRMNGRIRLSPMQPVALVSSESPREPTKQRVVELWFEKFSRKGQISIMCFTNEAALAMLLRPDFLPGQQRAVDELRDDRRSLEKLLMAALLP